MKWLRLRKFPPSPSAYIVRFYYDFTAHRKEAGGFWHFCHQVWGLRIYFVKKSFLQKSLVEELAENLLFYTKVTWLPHVVHPRVCNPLLHGGFADLPQNGHFLRIFYDLGPESATRGGGRMARVAILNSPPPCIREFFLFASFFLIAWHLGYFSDVSCPSWSSTSFWS
jgi:hypothetical protein